MFKVNGHAPSVLCHFKFGDHVTRHVPYALVYDLCHGGHDTIHLRTSQSLTPKQSAVFTFSSPHVHASPFEKISLSRAHSFNMLMLINKSQTYKAREKKPIQPQSDEDT
jgi:hypothetical protein